ncbi:Cell wall alpha-1,3-glucan synthase ags1 [Lasiodiplodia theobromae]|uniref:alpha-1,3-glucan synthase n=1 Tax=Lasiodiplodia theobromae TaxID=45133 RepID=A0A5N5D364_9PEZI|nr:Cell wall alpha-1,3-glucan synthase ags1 [Lasiodiplodia theobromae]
MGDLMGFKGHENESTPFSWNEHNYFWKSDRRYLDFQPGSEVDQSCEYPRFWDKTGRPVNATDLGIPDSCRDSEFDLYGEMEMTAEEAPYVQQLSKYGSVQDRLRDWRSDVRAKINHFSCMQIAMLDIDGFRLDKALQMTADGLADFSSFQRRCARRYGKENFLIVGELVGKKPLVALTTGRGKEPEQYWHNTTEAIAASNTSDPQHFVRDGEHTSIDGSSFSYDMYFSLAQFLGLDGDYPKGSVDFVSLWEDLLVQTDMVNVNTGVFDPRHGFGTTNQDVFRWPALANGTQRQLLGNFITTLMLPGVPALTWGEEQDMYILDSFAENYVYGRGPMSSSRAWQLHGCYQLTYDIYADLPVDRARRGCRDDAVSLDHKDAAHPVRNVLKRMYELRERYSVLNDGYMLKTLSNQTHDFHLPASDVDTPRGIFSVHRTVAEGVQDFSDHPMGNQGVWLVFSNEHAPTEFLFDCGNETAALLAPFSPGSRVKNLFHPYDEYTLESSESRSGCLSNITLGEWGFKAFVPADAFAPPRPAITKVSPSHDKRLLATVPPGQQQTVPIQMHFSQPMDCKSVARSLEIESTTADGTAARINEASITCGPATDGGQTVVAAPPGTWMFTAELENVGHGTHAFTVRNASTLDGGSFTNAVDRFMFRIGRADNPLVFPGSADYARGLLRKDDGTGNLHLQLQAPGAERFRYSRNWGSSWSPWLEYTSDSIVLEDQPWTGTPEQAWRGEHVIVEYWSRMASSSHHVHHGDLAESQPARRWPHAFVEGHFNEFGFDAGLPNAMALDDDEDGVWRFNISAEWPMQAIINVWGMNPDGLPDKSMQLGDVDRDGVLDLLPPQMLSHNVFNLSDGPRMPHVGWQIVVHDGNLTYAMRPVGSGSTQRLLFFLLALVPPAAGVLAVWAYRKSFYFIEHVGLQGGRRKTKKLLSALSMRNSPHEKDIIPLESLTLLSRRRVLMATLEYEIADWNIAVKIGGLGVMASLSGKVLPHQDLIWVVPCLGDIDYPFAPHEAAPPMAITMCGRQHRVAVYYHVLRNITFVLVDAPIFRQQTKGKPYPARMDDLDSAVFYAAWNACIAEALRRFQVDLYHVNDFHGALAPLHLLPETVPVALSLHNAEFQGAWPLRADEEFAEISALFNLDKQTIRKYVQYGELFNPLHAAVSYIRIHQKGFGVVGVSDKYGPRAYSRYPVFWSLPGVGSLSNPDPSDHGEAVVAGVHEPADRSSQRLQAQQWAGLNPDADADLFIFVGRWSKQKGIDLIADVFPSILDRFPRTQLICIGPIIDLHGKLAAAKLATLSHRFPGRVFAKGEFITPPPFLFGAGEFVLIPSRDEPFGLVTIEFGRRGALGIGPRIGGLGQMPGWWYNAESMASRHLITQLERTVEMALASSEETRERMRDEACRRRFPVARWVQDLDVLQGRAVEMSRKAAARAIKRGGGARDDDETETRFPSGSATAAASTCSLDGEDALLLSPEKGCGILQKEADSTMKAVDASLLEERPSQLLSLDSILACQESFVLQDCAPVFTDADGECYAEFARVLQTQAVRSTPRHTCIADFLYRAEKKWFARQYRGKCDRLPQLPSIVSGISGLWRTWFGGPQYSAVPDDPSEPRPFPADSQNILLYRIGSWPLYSLLIALGQILSVNAYQVTLLTGRTVDTAASIYTNSLIVLIGSICWWHLFRSAKSVYAISLPFLLFGLSFFLLTIALLMGASPTASRIQAVAIGAYAFGSAGGATFFALNFGTEGGVPTWTLVSRATAVQGLQQLYFAALSLGASRLDAALSRGVPQSTLINPHRAAPATLLAALALWSIAALLFLRLPDCYRSKPPVIPAFHRGLLNRRAVLWFLSSVAVRDFCLSGTYGRSWRFLWASRAAAPAWAVALLVVVFFGVVWVALLRGVCFRLSRAHPWLLPIFAIGLGAPRWAQMLWCVSQAGHYLPWVPGGPSAAAGALVSRGLWLWLGVLDSVQGIGFGMVLLGTLTRVHVVWVLATAQGVGAVCTAAARAWAPNNVGPGVVFPNLPLEGWGAAGWNVWFWVWLGLQVVAFNGYLCFFRREQLFKP